MQSHMVTPLAECQQSVQVTKPGNKSRASFEMCPKSTQSFLVPEIQV